MAARLQRHAAGAAWLRHFADAVDDPAGRATPIERGGRPLQNLDPLDVVQIAHILAVIAQTVEKEVAARTKAPDAQGIEPGVLRVADIGQPLQGLAQSAHAIDLGLGGIHEVQGLGHLAQRCIGAGA